MIDREINYSWTSGLQAYIARHRLSNGQFCQIVMYKHRGSRAVEFHVAFAVADKKRSLNGYFSGSKNDSISGKMTGRCGAEALYWCKDALAVFENDVAPRYLSNSAEVKIVVYGADPRRQRFYQMVLSRLGFRIENTCWGYGMVKRILKEDITR